ncbi:MAG TPA: hypothetical protein VHN73_00630 [Phenylobacterium sp.]|nr:hypothetical protein [Phenylobacterium sp.]
MNRLSPIGVLVVTALLAGCDRAAQKPMAPAASGGPTTERAGPVQWNTTTGAFELNGRRLKTIKLWTFEGSTEGFTAVRSKITPDLDQGLSVQIVDPTLRSPKGLNVPGAQYPLVLVRLTRTAAGEAWDGALYYSTAAHPEASTFFGKPTPATPPAVGETVTLVYDMGRQTVGAPDWIQSNIDQIRLDIEDKSGGAFVIRQVAIAENPQAATLPAADPLPAAKP